MKTYMHLNGLRWSRNSGSANCDMHQSAVFGRTGGGNTKRGDIKSVGNAEVVPITDRKMNVKAISFRDKDNGWKKYLMKMDK